jgi:hypothetical protein
MRTIGCCFIVLVLALMCVGVASANPGGGVKSSPLFKASLAQGIAKLEGKVEKLTGVGNQDEDMPTGKRICPNLPLTQQGNTVCTETCVAYETCYTPCVTYWVTCNNTCVGDPGQCRDYAFCGSVYWQYWGPPFQGGTDWSNLPGGFSTGDAGVVYVKFFDEQEYSYVSSVSLDGWYGGSYVRATTSSGASFRHTVWMIKDGSWYVGQGGGYHGSSFAWPGYNEVPCYTWL